MPETTRERSKIKVIALDDPWGALETTEGALAVRRAVERLRRAGYAQSDHLVEDPTDGQGRQVRMFQLIWKGVTWVVLASWDGSFAYRVPVDLFRSDDLFSVPSPDSLADFMPDDEDLDDEDYVTLAEVDEHALDDEARERLRQVRWTKVGLFTEVVDAILDLPELPGHSHFAAPMLIGATT